MSALLQLLRTRWLWLLALAAFCLRALVLSRFAGSPDFIPAGDDMRFYHDWALRILGGQWTDGQAFYGLPGYAYCLAILYAIGGPDPWLPGLLQCGLEALTTVFIARLALHVFASLPRLATPIALIASLGWVFCLPAQAFSIILMPTSWVVAAYWGLVLWVVKTDARTRWPTWLAMGLLTGVVAMLVATILMLLPLVFAAIWRWRPRQVAPLLGASVLIFAGFFIGCSPAWLHNRLIAREPVLLSAHSGINYWIGNNPTATGYPKIPAGLRASQQGLLLDSITLAEREAGRKLTRAEVSAHWSARAKAWIAADRPAWLALLARKFSNFWNAFQYDDVSIIPLLRHQRVLLPGLGFGFIAALALPAMFFAVWRVPSSRWIAASVLLHMAALMPVFITERYRLCALPGMLIFAAYGLCELWENFVHRRWLSPLAYTAATACAVLFVTAPRGDAAIWSIGHYRTGLRAQRTGDLDTALRELQLARAYVSDSAEIEFALGTLWLTRGDRAKAKVFLRHTVELNPAHADAWNNLGVIALEEKYLPTARRFLELAIRFEPGDAKTHYLLATACLELGDRLAARAAIDTALRLRPTQPEFIVLRSKIDAVPQ